MLGHDKGNGWERGSSIPRYTFPQMWGENVGKCDTQKGSNTPK